MSSSFTASQAELIQQAQNALDLSDILRCLIGEVCRESTDKDDPFKPVVWGWDLDRLVRDMIRGGKMITFTVGVPIDPESPSSIDLRVQGVTKCGCVVNMQYELDSQGKDGPLAREIMQRIFALSGSDIENYYCDQNVLLSSVWPGQTIIKSVNAKMRVSDLDMAVNMLARKRKLRFSISNFVE